MQQALYYMLYIYLHNIVKELTYMKSYVYSAWYIESTNNVLTIIIHWEYVI